MLIDTDIASVDRASPAPNAHDIVGPLMLPAKGTNAINYVTSATNLALVQAANSGQFTIVQTGTLLSQTFTASAGSGAYAGGKFIHAQVPHNLSYKPAFTGYYVNSAQQYTTLPRDYTAVGSSDGTNNPGPNGGWFSWGIGVDANYVYLYTAYLLYNYNLTTTPGQSFRYYLLQQSLV